jgi:hypothetical protein
VSTRTRISRSGFCFSVSVWQFFVPESAGDSGTFCSNASIPLRQAVPSPWFFMELRTLTYVAPTRPLDAREHKTNGPRRTERTSWGWSVHPQDQVRRYCTVSVTLLAAVGTAMVPEVAVMVSWAGPAGVPAFPPAHPARTAPVRSSMAKGTTVA